MTTFGTRLRIERESKKMTQPELAKIGGVRKNAQLLYEKDSSPPNVTYLMKIAQAGIDLHFLFYGVRSDSAASAQVKDLLTVLLNLSPEQQAIGFGMLSMLQLNAPNSAPDVRRADMIWRAVRLYNQFLGLDEKEQQMVEVAAKIMQMPPPDAAAE
jgi:transcriptional regulator with XRE-family HTH domain